jgi:hypothetical protein
MIEEDLGGAVIRYPEWAQCTVYRLVAGQKVAFVGPKTFWIETYATKKRDTKAPNAMWAKRPRGQLEKCAEAAALRRAFPEEIGNEYAAEEVEGQAFAARDVTPREGPNLAARLAAPSEPVTEGFTVHNGLDPDDHIPDFDAAPPVSDKAPPPAADDAVPGGADDFPGDRPGEDATEPPSDDDRGSVAFDHIGWADRFIADLPFLTLEQLDALEGNKLELARFAQLRAVAVDKAQEFEAALKEARAAFA